MPQWLEDVLDFVSVLFVSAGFWVILHLVH